MPRLPPGLFHQARNIHPLLPLVLRGTQDLVSAQNELRWLKEYVLSRVQQKSSSCGQPLGWQHMLRKLCYERSRGKPLQYIMGSEYFGDLEITCRPGVLIPRQATAASVTHLVSKLVNLPAELRVLDLCTGTGCIPLLFQHELRQKHALYAGLEVLGIDISSKAVELARLNLLKQQGEARKALPVEFAQADVLANDDATTTNHTLTPSLTRFLRSHGMPESPLPWDILISNPPYISPMGFNYTTTRSVRNFEPRLALVPETQHHRHDIDPGDVFYPRLLDIARRIESKMVLFEVADMDQARRIASMIESQGGWEGIEIWRDDPGCTESSSHENNASTGIQVIGCGNGRSVFAWRGKAREWLHPTGQRI